jgi:hypothetical protein
MSVSLYPEGQSQQTPTRHKRHTYRSADASLQTVVHLSSNRILNTNDDWHPQQQNVTLFRGVINVVSKAAIPSLHMFMWFHSHCEACTLQL